MEEKQRVREPVHATPRSSPIRMCYGPMTPCNCRRPSHSPANPSLTLLSADGDLNTAAMAEGLAVDNPNTHP